MINLDTVLYKLNRDSRQGDLESHEFLKLMLSGFVKVEGYYVLEFRQPAFGSETVYSSTGGSYKFSKEEGINWDSSKRTLYITIKDPSPSSIRKLLQEKESEIGFDPSSIKNNLLKLLEAELKTVNNKISSLELTKLSLEKDIKSIKLK